MWSHAPFHHVHLRPRLHHAVAILCCLLVALSAADCPAAQQRARPADKPAAVPQTTVILPRSKLTAAELAVVINLEDPASIALGEYYVAQRAIPASNVARVRLPKGPSITGEELVKAKAEVDAQLPRDVQAYALVWTQPYRAGCMSITSAFALGFDPRWCAQGCQPTARSPLFNTIINRPWDEKHIRPAMLLAAASLPHGKALVDRGVAADGRWPKGTAYLVETSDASRSVRAPQFQLAAEGLGAQLAVKHLKTQYITGQQDVLFYFTGLSQVPEIQSNRFLPGAMADHLTSAGGVLFDGPQMSVLRWLEAGATASYGTVFEPCNFVDKFPNAAVAMNAVLQGKTLLEAYWQSVATPGQGLFVGEPLAAPFSGMRVRRDGAMLEVETRSLLPGQYTLSFSADGLPPYQELGALGVFNTSPQRLRLPDPGPGVLFVIPVR